MFNLPNWYWTVSAICLATMVFYIIRDSMRALKARDLGVHYDSYITGEVIIAFIICFCPYLNFFFLAVFCLDISWSTLEKMAKFIKTLFYTPLIGKRKNKR